MTALKASTRLVVSCELWSINRWMRWTGFRLFVGLPEDDGPTTIGVRWWGWRD